jgi:hypothetical protein
MSESAVHRSLVAALMDDMTRHAWDSRPFLYADSNGLALPPLIGRARPDVYANFALQDRAVVGEAKTSRDLESFHTAGQFEAYFAHLATTAGGELWVAVPWLSAGAAIRVCTATKARMGSLVPFKVSAWLLGEQNFSRAWYG